MGIVEIQDHGLDDLFKAYADLESQVINAGILSSAGGDMASIAYWNHEGTARGIPPRPFIMQTMNEKQGDVLRLIQSAIAAVNTPADVDKALKRIGVKLEAILKRGITGGSFTPNAPETIKRKGSSKPLIDTGRLIGSIAYEIK